MSDSDLGNFFRTILAMSISGGTAALLLFAIKPLIKNRISKTAQYYLWLVVLVLLVVPFSATFFVMPTRVTADNDEQAALANYQNIFREYSAPVYTVRDALDRYVFSSEEEMDRMANVISRVGFDPVAIENTKSRIPISVIDLMMIFWPLGVLIFLAVHLSAYISFSTQLRKTLIPTEIRAGNVAVYKSGMIQTPMLIGLFRAKIVLPDRDYEPQELHNILLHELTHYRRRDIAVKWLAVIANAIHWFNPVVYFIRRKINRACELSCDEAVIRKLDADGRQSYGDTLINVGNATLHPYSRAAGTGACYSQKEHLKERLVSIMQHKKTGRAVASASVLLAALLLTGGFVMSATTEEKYGLKGTIPLESLYVSDTQTETLLGQIQDVAGAPTDDIFIGDGQLFNLTSDYQWEYTNVFQIFVSQNKTGGEPYERYQMAIQSESENIKLFHQPADILPEYKLSLRSLFDALKYIPKDELAKMFKSPPDSFIVREGRSFSYGEEVPRVYYNRNGVTAVSGWFIQLELQPMYLSDNGGYAGSGGDLIILCYGDTPLFSETEPPDETITIKGAEYDVNSTVLSLPYLELTDADIEPVKHMTNLTTLDLRNNRITDISVLRGLTKLQHLEIWGNQISDISALEDLTELTFLTLDNNQISDITTLRGLTGLTYLGLGENQITDINVLKDLSNLTEWLGLAGNKITDVSALGGLTKLTALGLSGNPVSDFSVLEKLTQLTYLDANETGISDIDILQGMTDMRELWLNGNQISGVNPLKSLEKLQFLQLHGNPISDDAIEDLKLALPNCRVNE